MTNLQAAPAHQAQQLALLPAAPRPAHTPRRREGFSAWVRREAELYRAVADAEQSGDARQLERARRRWRECMRQMPPSGGRRGRRSR